MDDVISRKAAIDALEEPCKVSDTWTDEYAVGERVQWEKDVKTLNSLSAVQPRKGKWIVDEKRFGHKEHHCNLCGAILEGDDWKWRNNYYCYHCGAKME